MSETNEATCTVIMCDRPNGGGIICRVCLGKLEKVLAETRWLLNELDIAITKQTRFNTSGGKVITKGQAEPLIINLQASDVKADLSRKLALWASDVSQSKTHTALAALSPIVAAAWLLAHLEDVRVFVAAADLTEEICHARAAALYVVDRPAERRYLGECGYVYDTDTNDGYTCTETLWGKDSEPWAVCKVCGAEWEMGQRLSAIRERAITGMEDRIMTATQAAETLVAYGIGSEDNATRLRDRIRKWAEVPRNPDRRAILIKRLDLPTPGQRKRPGYRLGDIIDIVNRAEARRAA